MKELDYPNEAAKAVAIKRIRKFYPLNQALPEARRLFRKTYKAEVKKQEQHEWDEEGDHCVKCNDPAWCASEKCAS